MKLTITLIITLLIISAGCASQSHMSFNERTHHTRKDVNRKAKNKDHQNKVNLKARGVKKSNF